MIGNARRKMDGVRAALRLKAGLQQGGVKPGESGGERRRGGVVAIFYSSVLAVLIRPFE